MLVVTMIIIMVVVVGADDRHGHHGGWHAGNAVHAHGGYHRCRKKAS